MEVKRGVSVFECTRQEVAKWMDGLRVEVEHDLCGRRATQRLLCEEKLSREQYRNLDSCRRALRRVNQPWVAEELVAELTVGDLRERLLAMPSGRHDINGVPVKRIPCAGEWFEVGVCWEPHDERWQKLRLADAISRVKSGYYPRLKDPPDLKSYYARLREEQRLELNVRVWPDEPEVSK